MTTAVTSVVTTTLGEALMHLLQDGEGSAALRGAAAALYEDLCDRSPGPSPRSAEMALGGRRAQAAVTLMAGCAVHNNDSNSDLGMSCV